MVKPCPLVKPRRSASSHLPSRFLLALRPVCLRLPLPSCLRPPVPVPSATHPASCSFPCSPTCLRLSLPACPLRLPLSLAAAFPKFPAPGCPCRFGRGGRGAGRHAGIWRRRTPVCVLLPIKGPVIYTVNGIMSYPVNDVILDNRPNHVLPLKPKISDGKGRTEPVIWGNKRDL